MTVLEYAAGFLSALFSVLLAAVAMYMVTDYENDERRFGGAIVLSVILWVWTH